MGHVLEKSRVSKNTEQALIVGGLRKNVNQVALICNGWLIERKQAAKKQHSCDAAVVAVLCSGQSNPIMKCQ